MIQLQRLTGMRPGEVVIMRALDVDMTGKIWLYRPGSDRGANGAHKTAWRGHDRVVAIGPQAQEVIREFLKPNVGAYLFSPTEAMEAFIAQRRKSRQTKVQPSRAGPPPQGEAQAAVGGALLRQFLPPSRRPHPDEYRQAGRLRQVDRGLAGQDLGGPPARRGRNPRDHDRRRR